MRKADVAAVPATAAAGALRPVDTAYCPALPAAATPPNGGCTSEAAAGTSRDVTGASSADAAGRRRDCGDCDSDTHCDMGSGGAVDVEGEWDGAWDRVCGGDAASNRRRWAAGGSGSRTPPPGPGRAAVGPRLAEAEAEAGKGWLAVGGAPDPCSGTERMGCHLWTLRSFHQVV